MDHRCLGVTRVRFAVQDKKAGVRTLSRLTLRRSYHAVPVTCFVRKRGHRCGEQLLLLLLDVAVVPVADVVALLVTVHWLLVVDGCCFGGIGGVVVC